MMMMVMMLMMMMMMMKMVKTVMVVMAMMHKRGMDSLVAGKKQYFARSYTGFYSDNIFPNGTTHERCEIKDCP